MKKMSKCPTCGMKSHVISHLKKDIKGYAKERKYLKKEEKEDQALIDALKSGKYHVERKKS